jgi:hypothetical protein
MTVTCPVPLVWRATLPRIRELGVRAITAKAAFVAGAFVFRGAGCEAACASREAPSTQTNMREKAILFITKPFEMKPPNEMNLPGQDPCVSLKRPGPSNRLPNLFSFQFKTTAAPRKMKSAFGTELRNTLNKKNSCNPSPNFFISFI